MRTPNPPRTRRVPRPSAFSVAVGNRIRELRSARGWSQRDFAAYTNLSISQISKYESGTHLPPLRTLIRISRVFGLTLDALLPDTELPPDPLEARLMHRLRRLAALGAREKEVAIGLLDLLLGAWLLSAGLSDGSPEPPDENS